MFWRNIKTGSGFFWSMEYQDTNYAQYRWARLLAGKTPESFAVVGDLIGPFTLAGAGL